MGMRRIFRKVRLLRLGRLLSCCAIGRGWGWVRFWEMFLFFECEGLRGVSVVDDFLVLWGDWCNWKATLDNIQNIKQFAFQSPQGYLWNWKVCLLGA